MRTRAQATVFRSIDAIRRCFDVGERYRYIPTNEEKIVSISFYYFTTSNSIEQPDSMQSLVGLGRFVHKYKSHFINRKSHTKWFVALLHSQSGAHRVVNDAALECVRGRPRRNKTHSMFTKSRKSTSDEHEFTPFQQMKSNQSEPSGNRIILFDFMRAHRVRCNFPFICILF